MDYKLNRKAQLTVFVIVGIIVIVALSFLLILTRNDADLRETDFDNPEGYLSLCVRERASSIIEEMLAGGGFIGKNDTINYMGEKYTYLCKNINNFEPCINQYPTYVSLVEKEFNEQIKEGAKNCFLSLKNDFEDKGYEFESISIIVDSKLKPNIFQISVFADVSLSKNGVSKKFSRFDTYVSTKMYELAKITNEILNDEASYCFFDHDEFMRLNPDYDVRLKLKDNSIKIYTIKNEESGEVLKMAVRGCAVPAGIFNE